MFPKFYLFLRLLLSFSFWFWGFNLSVIWNCYRTGKHDSFFIQFCNALLICEYGFFIVTLVEGTFCVIRVWNNYREGLLLFSLLRLGNFVLRYGHFWCFHYSLVRVFLVRGSVVLVKVY